jgi:hypothetical protein
MNLKAGLFDHRHACSCLGGKKNSEAVAALASAAILD